MQRSLFRSRSCKVNDFGTNRKLIYNCLLVINTNLPPILHRFHVMADYSLNFRQRDGVPHFNALDGGDPLSMSLQMIYREKLHSLIKISAVESIGVFSTTFAQYVPKATEFVEITMRLGRLRRSRSSKVTEFWYRSKAHMRLPISD